MKVVKGRYLWAGLIVVLALGFLKMVYPLPATRAADVVTYISGMQGSKEFDLNASRAQLERQFEKESLLGLALTSLGLLIGILQLKSMLTRTQIACTVVASTAFLGLFIANYINFESENTILGALMTHAELMITSIRVTQPLSKLNRVHELLSILCVLATLLLGVAEFARSLVKK